MTGFFLERPVFATVIAILIVTLGIISIRLLPLEQYPNMTPPMISITAQYPGATAQTMAESVAAPLEQSLNGTESMIYMFSQADSPGNLFLNLYFDVGTDANFALTNTQNRVNLTLDSLPDEVRKNGVIVRKSQPAPFLFIAIQAPEDLYDDLYIANYASIHIVDELQRIKGISVAEVLNALDYSMRIWLKPDRMVQYHLSTTDVINAVQAQSAVRSIGEIGQEPTLSPVKLTIPITASGQFTTPEQFESIVLRANPDGSAIYLRDVGHVDLGAYNYGLVGKLNGNRGSFIRIFLDPEANALEVAANIKRKMEDLTQFFPPALTYSFPYDTSQFIRLSITELEKSVVEAALIVALIIFLFLNSIRATLVPVIAMIVSIVGSFTGVLLLGFSINTLTLFGMVLAIGIVVDDAIVVVENIERNMRSLGLSAKDAAIKTMQEVSRPIIAITLILCSVFIPVAFVGGIPGKFYKHFALSISLSIIISGFISLTLSPVLSYFLLRDRKIFSPFANSFHRGFEKVTNLYVKGASWILHRKAIGLGIFGAILIAIVGLTMAIPSGFTPEEDQGAFVISASLPDGAALSRTEAVSTKIREIVEKSPAVENILTFSGWGVLESLQKANRADIFVSLKDWNQRKSQQLKAPELIKTLNEEFAEIPEAKVVAMNLPAISGLDVVSGFSFWVVNRSDADMTTLNEVVNQIVEKAKTYPEFQSFITTIQANGLELYLDLDVEKAIALGVSIDDAYQTLEVLLSSYFVNQFIKYGKVFKVIAQADPEYRNNIEGIGNVFVRSKNNVMVPLKSIVIPRFSTGPALVSRFNGAPAALISITPAIGANPKKVISAMENIAKEFLLPGMSYDWGGLAFEEKESGGASSSVLIGGVLMVFLVLAALYERWTLPITILLAIPFAVFGALLAIWIRNMENDIYFQIGMLTLIGLAAKNAILIVEFARVKRKEGLSINEAVLTAARLRFRAIIMTSLSLIFGALPLLFISGAGAASRHSVGTGVIGGMVMATFLAIFFVPLFFKMIEEFMERRNRDY